ncbi:glycerol kinase [Wickerhamomyces ciferrii]|uniref:glycerol kinase n=1 Tax=Wickerhamomyces ciferrii (strain ATCC 14091 / BCRC 22168 / CBS 111 / JCM 3599 / NBRC 0793 / NRRL Y-1031 F-60-10) TaxID=1206466 RepID=K0KPE0_WICCF|nr:glycerol kinase [Wickerhamomyces ciferrii]CCH44821.1 glycerol kinase [Wickerhamomyces ciferrii]
MTADKEYKLVASIDIGTTSTRAILFNRRGEEVASHQIEYSTTANTTTDGKQKIYSAEGIQITATDDLEIEREDTEDGPTLTFPNPGWVEIKPTHIISNAVTCLASCKVTLDKVNKERKSRGEEEYKIVSIGIANMRETTILWDKDTGRAVHDGIVWNDTRTTDIVQDMLKNIPEEKLDAVKQKSGLTVSTYFSASKLRWLLDNKPHVKQAYEAGQLMFGTVDTWLMYHITQDHTFATDVTNASRTMFMDIKNFKYDSELFDLWNIDPELLQFPEIRSSSELFGYFKVPNLEAIGAPTLLTKEGEAALKSLGPLIPINGVLGDQSSSMVGQLALKKGSAKCTYGTGCFLLLNTGSQPLNSDNGAVTTVGYWFKNLQDEEDATAHYALEGSIAVAGSCVQWLRDNLKLIEKAQDIGPLATLVPNAGGVVFVPAFSGLFAPYWDPDARGTIFGLTQYTSASHIARAALEGICYQARAILKAMATDAGEDPEFMEDGAEVPYEQGPSNSISQLAIDGGLSKSNEFVQIQSDILGPCVKIRKTPVSEATALGAAIAAGCGFEDDEEKVWTSIVDVQESLQFDDGEVFQSQLDSKSRRQNWNLWTKAVDRAKGWNSGKPEDLTVEELEQRIDVLKNQLRLKKISLSKAEKAKISEISA